MWSNSIDHLSPSSLSHCQLLLAGLFAPDYKFLTSKLSQPLEIYLEDKLVSSPIMVRKLNTGTPRGLPQPRWWDPRIHRLQHILIKELRIPARVQSVPHGQAFCGLCAYR